VQASLARCDQHRQQHQRRLTPPLNQSPFIPAKAGIQEAENSAKELGPRFRGDERN
jgi:hypothetical protein